jgi:hypothetical protein
MGCKDYRLRPEDDGLVLMAYADVVRLLEMAGYELDGDA